jgi:hypothetical protein
MHLPASCHLAHQPSQRSQSPCFLCQALTLAPCTRDIRAGEVPGQGELLKRCKSTLQNAWPARTRAGESASGSLVAGTAQQRRSRGVADEQASAQASVDSPHVSCKAAAILHTSGGIDLRLQGDLVDLICMGGEPLRGIELPMAFYRVQEASKGLLMKACLRTFPRPKASLTNLGT